MSWKNSFPKENRFFETENGILYNGDCLDVMKEMPKESIDLILTDPPYLKKYLYTYEYLAIYGGALLKRGGSLITIVGHYAIPNIIKLFDGKLKYRWTFCMNQEKGSHPRMAMGIEVMWKPILWYVKESYPNGRGFIKDMLKIDAEDGINKKFHKWQQSQQWADFFISKLTFSQNDIVLDPFIGSGTTAIACEKLNRKWIGIEINRDYCEIVKERIKDGAKPRFAPYNV